MLSGEVLLEKSSTQRLAGTSLLQGICTSFSCSRTLQSPRTSHELTKSDTLVRFLPVGDSQSSLGSPLLVPRRPKARRGFMFVYLSSVIVAHILSTNWTGSYELFIREIKHHALLQTTDVNLSRSSLRFLESLDKFIREIKNNLHVHDKRETAHFKGKRQKWDFCLLR